MNNGIVASSWWSVIEVGEGDATGLCVDGALWLMVRVGAKEHDTPSMMMLGRWWLVWACGQVLERGDQPVETVWYAVWYAC